MEDRVENKPANAWKHGECQCVPVVEKSVRLKRISRLSGLITQLLVASQTVQSTLLTLRVSIVLMALRLLEKTFTALGKGNVCVKTTLGEKFLEITLLDVWYATEISRNLFSVLPAQDRNTNSEFRSS
ncbi:hypothetical protein AVEN_124942-1 [Araneus ventricosus]|uniref:Retrovirus-related Pol polyprotein from transposon TNT 1-94-like beta-barrel domain-containing protein n=1 Tax=Araneus ventricosus TaxID=182803 RepID=A0A4Y2V0L4_ARAVE|nr:hypothetical protein AVEN_155242-1 [Araneus ventricosus]GBO18072.1 hypothetical protein AVEN_124942-1 [Araneus ventricosus]